MQYWILGVMIAMLALMSVPVLTCYLMVVTMMGQFYPKTKAIRHTHRGRCDEVEFSLERISEK